ncbi:hypothetical protein BT93_F1458 [Corymbia citriodora subsp. variegata]|nr:hypothetical protein BT93_F1458 [Corymbia citriodora subsp. variegata]KAF8024268.1 hypothetical protein BT93_F1458 [Corymbia citriodora subsp. variegata]
MGDGRYGEPTLVKILYNSIFENFEGSIFSQLCQRFERFQKLELSLFVRKIAIYSTMSLPINSSHSLVGPHSHPLSRYLNEIFYSTSCFKVTPINNTYFPFHQLKKPVMWRKISFSPYGQSLCLMVNLFSSVFSTSTEARTQHLRC